MAFIRAWNPSRAVLRDLKGLRKFNLGYLLVEENGEEVLLLSGPYNLSVAQFHSQYSTSSSSDAPTDIHT